MPRKAGMAAAGALHHIIARGIEREKNLLGRCRLRSFVNRLGKVLIEIHANNQYPSLTARDSVYIEHRERSLVNRQSDLVGNESAEAHEESVNLDAQDTQD